MYDPKFHFNSDTQNYDVLGPSATTVAKYIHLAFARDVEGKMRSALIAMGWVPPKEAADAERALAAALDAAVRKGVAVHWDALTAQLVQAHDAIANLKPTK